MGARRWQTRRSGRRARTRPCARHATGQSVARAPCRQAFRQSCLPVSTGSTGCPRSLRPAAPARARNRVFQAPISCPHDVFRFQVAMRDPGVVGACQSVCELAHRVKYGVRCGTQLTAHLVTQRLSLHVFERHEQLPVDFFERIHRADARMDQRRGGPRLALKPFALSGVLQQAGASRNINATTRLSRVSVAT